MSNEHSLKLIYVQYTDKQALYNAYMSFCRDGGLFVPGAFQMHLGTNVNLLVEIPTDSTIHAVSGKVSWINANKKKGIGLRLNADEFGKKLRNSIENTLAGLIKSPNPTYTM